jgi:MFS family permease
LLSLPTWASNIGTHSPLFWAILVCGLITLLVLIQHSRRTAAPVLDTKILSTKAFSLPLAIFWLHVLFTSSVLYALAFFMNNRPGGNASQFGMMTLFMFGSAMLSSPIAGRLCDRFEARRVSLFALIGTLGGSFLFLTIRIDSSLAHIATICSLLGIMLGANTPASMKMAFGAIPPERIGVGTGMFSMFRDMASPTGSSLALAIFGTALADKAGSALSRLVDRHALDVETMDALIRAATNRGPLPEPLAAQLQNAGINAPELIQTASAEALQGALTQVGYLICIPILIAILLATQLVRTRQASAPGAFSSPVSAMKPK